MDKSIFRNKNRRNKLYHDGFVYMKHKRLASGRILWRCTHRKIKCEGSIFTSSKSTYPIIGERHNHDRCKAEVKNIDFYSTHNLFIISLSKLDINKELNYVTYISSVKVLG